MDLYSMTDKGIAAEIGERVRALRLRRNLTQQQVAENTMLSLNSIKALEVGKAKLTTFIAVLRALGALEGMEGVVPELSISPLQLARQQGKVRQRASGKRGKGALEDKAKW